MGYSDHQPYTATPVVLGGSAVAITLIIGLTFAARGCAKYTDLPANVDRRADMRVMLEKERTRQERFRWRRDSLRVAQGAKPLPPMVLRDSLSAP